MLREMAEADEDARIREQEAEDLRTAKEAMKDKEKMDLLLGRMAF